MDIEISVIITVPDHERESDRSEVERRVWKLVERDRDQLAAHAKIAALGVLDGESDAEITEGLYGEES